MFGGCGGLERTDLWQFPCWEGVVALKELIYGVCFGGCGCLERTCWEGVVVLKELIFNSLCVGRV